MVGPSLDGRQESKTVACSNSKARNKAQSYLKKAESCCLVLFVSFVFFLHGSKTSSCSWKNKRQEAKLTSDF